MEGVGLKVVGLSLSAEAIDDSLINKDNISVFVLLA